MTPPSDRDYWTRHYTERLLRAEQELLEWERNLAAAIELAEFGDKPYIDLLPRAAALRQYQGCEYTCAGRCTDVSYCRQQVAECRYRAGSRRHTLEEHHRVGDISYGSANRSRELAEQVVSEWFRTTGGYLWA